MDADLMRAVIKRRGETQEIDLACPVMEARLFVDDDKSFVEDRKAAIEISVGEFQFYVSKPFTAGGPGDYAEVLKGIVALVVEHAAEIRDALKVGVNRGKA